MYDIYNLHENEPSFASQIFKFGILPGLATGTLTGLIDVIDKDEIIPKAVPGTLGIVTPTILSVVLTKGDLKKKVINALLSSITSGLTHASIKFLGDRLQRRNVNKLIQENHIVTLYEVGNNIEKEGYIITDPEDTNTIVEHLKDVVDTHLVNELHSKYSNDIKKVQHSTLKDKISKLRQSMGKSYIGSIELSSKGIDITEFTKHLSDTVDNLLKENKDKINKDDYNNLEKLSKTLKNISNYTSIKKPEDFKEKFINSVRDLYNFLNGLDNLIVTENVRNKIKDSIKDYSERSNITITFKPFSSKDRNIRESTINKIVQNIYETLKDHDVKKTEIEEQLSKQDPSKTFKITLPINIKYVSQGSLDMNNLLTDLNNKIVELEKMYNHLDKTRNKFHNAIHNTFQNVLHNTKEGLKSIIGSRLNLVLHNDAAKEEVINSILNNHPAWDYHYIHPKELISKLSTNISNVKPAGLKDIHVANISNNVTNALRNILIKYIQHSNYPIFLESNFGINREKGYLNYLQRVGQHFNI